MKHVRSKLNKKLLAFALLAILINGGGTSNLALAEEPNSIKTPEEAQKIKTGEVIVSATRTEKELFDVSSSASVVSQQQIERNPQSTIANVLQDIPGLQITDTSMGGGAKRVRIRGESAARVLLLIDGMKISEQKSMDGSMILIDPSNVERVEVIKGPASVLYGSEAIGGVVNIITKKGGSKAVQGTLATTYDSSNESFTPYASIFGSHKGFGYRVSGDYTDAGDKRVSSHQKLPNSDYLQHNYSAYLDYTWDNGKAGVGYDHFKSQINIPLYTMSSTTTMQLDVPNWERERFYGFIEFSKISDYLQKIRLNTFTQETIKDFDQVTRVQPSPTKISYSHMLTKNTQRSYGASMQTDWTFGTSHYVVAGLDFLRDNLDATDDRDGYSNMTGKLTTTSSGYKYKAHQDTAALFIQDEWSLLDDWTATLGLRHTIVKSALDSTNNSKLEEKSTNDSHTVVSAGLVYSGFDDWRLRALYSQGYRYPLLQQLYIGTVHGSTNPTLPNSELKPETSQNFEIGARYEAYGVSADLSVYYNTAKNYLTTISKGTYQSYENIQGANTYGSELTLSYTYEPWKLTPYVSGAYMYREFDRGTEQYSKTALTGDPRWSGKAGLRYEYDIDPTISIHTDANVRMAAIAKEESTTGVITKDPGWATLNFSIGTKFGEDKKYFVDLNLNNILDKKYKLAASELEDPGFNAVIRLGVDF